MSKKWQRIDKKVRKNNYPSFDRALDLHFSDNPPNKLEDLKRLMKDYAFRTKDNEKLEPTDKQLDHAWRFIKQNYFPQQILMDNYFKAEKYRTYYVYRANKNVEYKGKKYRKGQFLPKSVEVTQG